MTGSHHLFPGPDLLTRSASDVAWWRSTPSLMTPEARSRPSPLASRDRAVGDASWVETGLRSR